jgi:hypothetical protein
MIHQPELAGRAVAAEKSAEALYRASCAVGDLLHLLDTMALVLGEEWTDPAATCRQMLGCTRIAREAVASTLSALLLAEGNCE